MARKDWVDKLIKPEQDNWFEKSLKRAKQNESKATGVSSDGYVDPSTISEVVNQFETGFCV